MFSWRKNVGWLLSLFLIGFFVYAFNLGNELFWDDDDWIIMNPYVHSFSWENLKLFFTTDILHGFGLSSNYYRPLLLISFAFNWAIGEASPFSYHLLSNLFHIGSGLLIFAILTPFLNQRAAFLASLFWLLHPIGVEAVAYISGRGDPMSVFFMLLALWLWVSTKDRWLRQVASPAFVMVLGILSRETAILFPALAMVFYIAFMAKGRFWQALKTGLIKTLPFWVISAGYFLMRATILNFENTFNWYAESNIYSENLIYRLYTFQAVLVEYFKIIFWPFGLHMERVFPVFTSLLVIPVLLGIAIVLTILFIGYRRYLKGKTGLANPNFKIWLVGWGWFFIGLAPVSGIIPINALIYEHWLYLPLIGFAMIVGFYMDKALAALGGKKGILVAILAVYLVFLGVLTADRNLAWGNAMTFYEDIVRYNPTSIRILNNLANEYAEKGRLDDAEKVLNLIISYDDGKSFPQPYYNLGNLYRQKGNFDKAEEFYLKSLEVDPNFHFAYQNLANLYYQQGNIEKTVEMVMKLKELRPDDPQLDIILEELLK